MYIKNNMTDTEGFALDTARIGNTSTSKTKIVLPYNGSLPVDLRGTTSAAIVITLQVGLTVNILLTVERDRRKYRYPLSRPRRKRLTTSCSPSFSMRTAKPDAAPAWIATVWDSGREATLTGVGLCWRNTGLTIFFSNLPPLPSKECCSISDTAKRHNASKRQAPPVRAGGFALPREQGEARHTGEPSHFQNHILSDICSQYLSSIAYP